MSNPELSRREFLKVAGLTTVGVTLFSETVLAQQWGDEGEPGRIEIDVDKRGTKFSPGPVRLSIGEESQRTRLDNYTLIITNIESRDSRLRSEIWRLQDPTKIIWFRGREAGEPVKYEIEVRAGERVLTEEPIYVEIGPLTRYSVHVLDLDGRALSVQNPNFPGGHMTPFVSMSFDDYIMGSFCNKDTGAAELSIPYLPFAIPEQHLPSIDEADIRFDVSYPGYVSTSNTAKEYIERLKKWDEGLWGTTEKPETPIIMRIPNDFSEPPGHELMEEIEDQVKRESLSPTDLRPGNTIVRSPDKVWYPNFESIQV